MSFKHTFYIEPVAKGRPRLSKFGAYTPAKTKKFENTLKALARRAIIGDPMRGALSVVVNFVIKKPKTTKNERPVVRPDLDNFLKGTLDSLNGIFWEDDSQIVRLMSSKQYGEQGLIEIEVLRLETKEGGKNG